VTDQVRIDKWLWAARFYKTRGLAAQAVTGGHVRLNGLRVKPAKAVKIGDLLDINKEGYLYRIEVTGLSERRGPATVARTLYDEGPESVEQRERQREQRRLAALAGPHPDRRPDKRARRKLRETRLKNLGD
jgi:ribosome-associated heat shock protein Hsp15